eukprot:COSAG02_NODE_651_length_18910_cov_12.561639_3_plen_223_part_00
MLEPCKALRIEQCTPNVPWCRDEGRGEWYSWCQRTAVLHTGPVTVHGSFAIDEIPVWVRAGSIIPMKTNTEPAQNRSTVATLLVWKVFPVPNTGDNAQRGTGRLYEDRGEGLGYQEAQYQEFLASQIANTRNVSVGIEAIHGGNHGFAPLTRTQQVELLSPKSRAATSVHCNAQHVPSTGVDPGASSGRPGWWLRSDGPWHVLVVRCPTMAYQQKLTVVVEW